jgi:hypothetical protein
MGVESLDSSGMQYLLIFEKFICRFDLTLIVRDSDFTVRSTLYDVIVIKV